METISGISANSTAVSVNTSDAAKISSDFDTFLKMLTAQIQNQDPLNPMDSSDFSTQLATFSGVEQQVRTNDLLLSLGTQMGSLGLGQQAAWIGMEARSTAPVGFTGDPVTLFPKFAPNTTRADLVVRNNLGAEVQRIAIDKTEASIQWRGTRDDGSFFSNGSYKFEIESYNNDDLVATKSAETYTKITEVKLEHGKSVLVLAGGIEIDSSTISALRQPQ